MNSSAQSKSKLLTIVLAFLGAPLGIHRFYLGDTRIGLVFLGSTVVAILLILLAIAEPSAHNVNALILSAGILLASAVKLAALSDFVQLIFRGKKYYQSKAAAALARRG